MIRHLLLVMMLCPMLLQAQSLPIHVELGAGAGAGWWVYNKGLTDTLPSIHRGYDRTHLSMVWPTEIAVSYSHKQWEWGLALGQRTLSDNQMIGSDHRRGRSRKYTISVEGKKNVPIQHLSLFGRGYLLKRRHVWIGASGSIGVFYMVHQHPQKFSFRKHIAQEIGIVHLIWLSPHLALTIHPQVSNYRITTESPFDGEKHNIYSLAARVGVRMSLMPHSSSP
ncbi:MAG: hypothetical protein AAF587_39020 [Bacteroidota bacterium]